MNIKLIDDNNRVRLSTEDVRRIVGTRLKEVMSDKGYTQAMLIRETREKFGEAYTMLPSHLSEVIHYKRSLPHAIACKFAEILNIDAGYLIGSDQFLSEDYAEYLSNQEHSKRANHEFSLFSMYDDLLNHLGYSVDAFSAFGDSYTYSISHNGMSAPLIPMSEMEQLREDVNKLIVKRMDLIMEKYRDPEYEEYLKQNDTGNEEEA